MTIFDRSLRFASHFFLNPNEVPAYKNWYDFKSNKPAPHVKELKDFRNDLLKMSENLEFRDRTNEFMKKLNTDVARINDTEKVIVKADKTSNRYLMEKNDYKTLRAKSINEEYKIEDPANVDKVNLAHANIVNS